MKDFLKITLLRRAKSLCSNIDLWLEYHDPWYWWRKAKEKYPPPIPVMVSGEYYGYFGLPLYAGNRKGIHFYSIGLGWKPKLYGKICDPIICVIMRSPFKTVINIGEFGSFTYHKEYWFGFTFQPDYSWVELLDYVFEKENGHIRN